MAAVVGEAGGSALRGALLRAVAFPAGLLTFIFVAAPFVVHGYSRTASRPVFVIIVLLVWGAGIFITRRDWIDAFEMMIESRDWAKGAAGERAASQDLAQLPGDYLVLNDVHPGFRGPSARWNWDHVVTGPKGIFVIDAKNYSAQRVRVGDSRTRRNVEQVRNYARSFKTELVRLNPELGSVFVVPLLAYVNESTWVEQLRDGDVRVLPRRLVRNDILTGPGSRLPVGEAVKIANLLFGMYPVHQQAEYREEFLRWASKVRSEPWPVAPQGEKRETLNASIGPCPLCGAEMRLRSESRNPFYGCSNYGKSGCRGKRAMDGTPK